MWVASVVIWAIVVPAFAYWVAWRWRYRRMLKLASSMPGPPALPIVGNALMFLTKPTEVLKSIGTLFDVYGDYVRLWMGPELAVCVKDPADIKLLLTSNKINEKGPLYKNLVPYIGPGILTGGSLWRNHRKIVTPSYNKKSVQNFSNIFNIESDNLVKVLKKRDSQTFDIFHDVVMCTTQSVCRTLMGLTKEESMNLPRLEEVVMKTQRIYNLIFKQMTHWWLQIPAVFFLTRHKKEQEYYTKLIDEFSSAILENRRKAIEKKETAYEDSRGIVDRLILSGELTAQDVKSELFTLFTTSQEAGAKIACGVLLMLAHLPDWQEKVFDEIEQVVGSASVTEAHIKQLQYLDMVYKETLRYFAIAAFIQRTVEEEITINKGKIVLPVGTSVIIPIHVLHRDPRYWEEPHRAKPERFLPENVKKRDPNAFIPFSLGPMDCLGRVFATSMIKTIVVHVVRKFHLETDGEMNDIPLEVAISVRASEGYQLRVKPRKPAYQGNANRAYRGFNK